MFPQAPAFPLYRIISGARGNLIPPTLHPVMGEGSNRECLAFHEREMQQTSRSPPSTTPPFASLPPPSTRRIPAPATPAFSCYLYATRMPELAPGLPCPGPQTRDRAWKARTPAHSPEPQTRQGTRQG